MVDNVPRLIAMGEEEEDVTDPYSEDYNGDSVKWTPAISFHSMREVHSDENQDVDMYKVGFIFFYDIYYIIDLTY